ncbi:MAG: hypothetical protein OK454_02620 [Thaumarchaeota archaeon]|nr:hypothetical protein [Nitrososphaerota archaeon]
MEPFAFTALGLLLGATLCLLSACAYHLYSSSQSLRHETSLSLKVFHELIRSNTSALSQLDTRLTSALSTLDAAQLHEASLSVARSALRMARTTGMLQKLAYSQEGAAALAAEDAESFAETLPLDPSPAEALTYQRWLHQHATEKQRVESVVQRRPANPLPDIQEGFDQDAEEASQLGL